MQYFWTRVKYKGVVQYFWLNQRCGAIPLKTRVWCNTFGLNKYGLNKGGAILLDLNKGVVQYFWLKQGLNKVVVQYFWD